MTTIAMPAPTATPTRATVRITARGAAFLACGAALVALGLVLRAGDLVGLGVGALALAALAALRVTSAHLLAKRHAVTATRSAPTRLVVGQAGPVSVALAGPRVGILDRCHVQDQLGAGLVWAEPSAPQAAASSRDQHYQVLAHSPGRWRLGPVRATVSDRFALARAGVDVGHADELVVWPQVVALPSAETIAARPTVAHSVAGLAEPDDAVLRGYVAGDDLRRIHWPSSARRGSLLVRAEEGGSGVEPVTVYIDPQLRSGPQAAWTISHAASIALAYLDAGHPVRLASDDVGPFLSGADARVALLDAAADLATGPDPTDGSTTLAALARTRGVVVTLVAPAQARAALALPRSGRTGAAVVVAPAGAQVAASLQAFHAAGWRATGVRDSHEATWLALNGLAA